MNKKALSKFGAAALLIGLVVAGYILINQMGRDKARAAASATGQPAVPVTIAIAEARDVPVVIRGLGNVQAYKTVAIRSRVEGQIVKISFEEGQNVKAGDQLFQIDPRPFQAALDQASANLKKDEAQLEGAQLDLERYGKLVPTGFQSKQSWDQQKATVDSLRASIDADKAQIDNAKLNLSFADIRAPIDGRTGQRLVDLGNMVQANQNTTLVTITQIKPIFVNFTVPQFANHNLRKNQAKQPLTVIAYSADDTYKLAQGELTLIDNQIEAQTGTLQAQGHLRQHRRTAVAGRVRQRAARAVDAQGCGHRAATRRHAGRQRRLRLRHQARQHRRAPRHRNRVDAGRLHRRQQGPRRRRESRARRPVPPVQRQPGAHRPAGRGPRGFRPQGLTLRHERL